MHFKLDKKTLTRIGLILILIAILPFSFEMVFLIDIGGIDFALTFLVMYLSTFYNTLLVKWDNLKRELVYFVSYVASLYMFQPKVFVPHVAASSLIVTISCSLLLACLFWIPLMYISSGFLT